ncbi:hypothetical protein B0O99DRAFT_656292 [Bisporella sp. PMI_857]|nr:hypothetical protein B0O99DRAFT_656292 [Bisporella sp. PMI_857]
MAGPDDMNDFSELLHVCYIDAENDIDEMSADGSEARPFQSLAHAYIQNINKLILRYSQAEPVPPSTVRSQPLSGEPVWKEPTKSAVKQKHQKQRGGDEQQRKDREAALEEAKRYAITEDASPSPATSINSGNKSVQVGDGDKHGVRVKLYGRIHHLRVQNLATFVTLADGYGELQCALQAGNLTKSVDALLSAQALLYMRRTDVRLLPITSRFFGHAPADSDALTHRESAFQNIVYKDMKITKVSPPALVQTQVESGSTLFKVRYYDEDAYLTQSSYGYCIEKSFRAEKSLNYINFSGPLDHIKKALCTVIDKLLEDEETASHIKLLKSKFQNTPRPFFRMKYTGAIKWFNVQDPPIFNEEASPTPSGMTLLKPQKNPLDLRVTESANLLMPGVGEIVGAWMRLEDYDDLIAASDKQGMK